VLEKAAEETESFYNLSINESVKIQYRDMEIQRAKTHKAQKALQVSSRALEVV
jgi:hypothetical protein